jgi:hypothetical protein
MWQISNFYYQRLNTEQKQAYELIREGLGLHKRAIVLSTSHANISQAYNAVLLDNPIFYYSTTLRIVKKSGNSYSTLIPIYGHSRRAILQYVNVMQGFLRSFDGLKNKSDAEKELLVHDCFLENFTYDYSFSKRSFSPIGLLMYKTGVCSGISKLVKIVFDYLNVECMLVSGTAVSGDGKPPESHMWNIVSINGNTYHLDVTFNLTQTKSVKRYDYFNLSDAEIMRDHTITPNMPKCKTPGRDYYSANSLVANNTRELAAIIRNALKNNRDSITIKLNNRYFISESNVADKVSEIALRQCKMPLFGSVTVDVNFNPSQHIYELTFTQKTLFA